MSLKTDIITERLVRNVTGASKGTLDSFRPGSGTCRTLMGGSLSEFVRVAKRYVKTLETDLNKALDATSAEVHRGTVTLKEPKVFGFSSGSGIEVYFIIDGIDNHDQMWSVLEAMKRMGYRVK